VTRPQWIALAVLGPPALLAAAVVSATLGPIGALFYAGLLLAGVNTRHLFRLHRSKGPQR
jgi:hypothetical protein